ARGRKADPAWTRKLPASALIWILEHMHPDYGGPSPAPEAETKTHVPLKDLARDELKKLAETYDWLRELGIRQAAREDARKALDPAAGGRRPDLPAVRIGGRHQAVRRPGPGRPRKGPWTLAAWSPDEG
ncbi:MAG: hypothetical protein LBT40_16295, partial [Deltaproteobacteria bacterium]|nr:hypothetical protein [Deltaproteobacteria bacterium]